MQSIDALLSRLHELAADFSIEQRPVFHQGVSADSISALQKAVAAQLPQDFAYFLSKCDSIVAMDVWNGYWIGGAEPLMRSIARKDFPSKVWEGSSSMSIVPVASDGEGNAFLLSLDGDKVWKWNHETDNSTLVAHGFSSFLARIIEDWEHFLLDDRDWRYLSG